MRYIDLDKLRLPDGWLAKADNASKSVQAGSDPNDFSQVWRDLKDDMFDLSKFKCWYCESSCDRADNAVDHFRPKNRVSEALRPHRGYRWLAFDVKNYRLSCTFCNSRRIDVPYGTAGGKADHFPLLDEATRVYASGSLLLEKPKLLDPCDYEDCLLLGCKQENGKSCCSTTDPIQIGRVTASTEIYHLDRESTCILRHGAAVGIVADIQEGKLRFKVSKDSEEKRQEFLNVAKRILKRISADAPYSGEMRYILRGQRSDDHPWVAQLLEV